MRTIRVPIIAVIVAITATLTAQTQPPAQPDASPAKLAPPNPRTDLMKRDVGL